MSRDKQYVVEPDWDRLTTTYDRFVAEPSIEVIDEFKALADEGSLQSMLYLGIAYRDGQGVKIDEEKASEYFDRANDLGLAIAGYYLGLLYFDQKKYRRSFETLSDWEDGNYAPTLCRLAYLYQKGYGVEKQFDKARLLFERSSNMGNIWAKRKLAEMYMTGKFGIFRIAQGFASYLIAFIQWIFICKPDMSDERTWK